MKRYVGTIGVFDGVHRGHRFLIDRTREEAALSGRSTVVFTFDPHPAVILAPARAPRLLTPGAEKVSLIEAALVDEVVVIRFDRDVSLLSPEEFVDRYLLHGRELEHLVIGHDFALGRNRTGDAARLASIGIKKGFSLTRVPALRHEGVVVSSTVIREAVASGDLERARSLLGRHYSALGRVVAGEGRGRTLGFPTANLELPPEKLMPPFGVYAVQAGLDPLMARPVPHDTATDTPIPAVLNYGTRPTFEGRAPSVEAHLIGFTGDLTGRTLEVRFVARIRDEQKFETAGALVTQIERDVAKGREILGA